MRMIRDRTGRFEERPYYKPGELDFECEQVVESFLRQLHGRVTWPIATDDLTKLVEDRVADLDLYADLSPLGSDVEGVTDFVRGKRPSVRISSELSEHSYHENRLRTTLTHELGHVHFHGYLFQLDDEGSDLFSLTDHAPSKASSTPVPSQQCRRETILDAREVDWMEWQAGYACGAFLMPITALRRLAQKFIERSGGVAGIVVDSPLGTELIEAVMATFAVSRDAARVRLSKTGLLLSQGKPQGFFE